MIDKTKKTSLSKVELIEFLEFYKSEICDYLYKYILEDDTELVISFKEENFSHLLGLHKFKKIGSYKTSLKINEDIIDKKIILKELINNEKKVLTSDLKDRICYFPMIRLLLEKADIALKYDINAIWNTKIEFSFLFRTNQISVIIYLAVKKISENKKVCIPISFLVDRTDRFSKIKLKELKVKKIDIIKK